MNTDQSNIVQLQEKVAFQMNGYNIFDIPEGRHNQIIDDFYEVKGNNVNDDLTAKLKFIVADFWQCQRISRDTG